MRIINNNIYRVDIYDKLMCKIMAHHIDLNRSSIIIYQR